MRYNRRSIPLLVALALLAGACSGNDDVTALPEPEETTSSSTTSSSTTTTSTTVPTTKPIPTPDDGEAFDEHIANRVEAFYEVVGEIAFQPSDDPLADYPQLLDVAAKDQLDAVVSSSQRFAEAGRRVVETSEPAVGTSIDEEYRVSGVISNDGKELTVSACEVDDEDVVDAGTGEVLEAGVITIERTVTLELIDGLWKVTSTSVTDKVEGVGGCYLATESDYPY